MITSADAQREYEDLENLRKHPGWQRFTAWVLQDGVQAVESEMARALDNDNDQVAAGRMRQAIAGKRAVERAIRWPHDRIKSLSGEPEQDPSLPPSRRGNL